MKRFESWSEWIDRLEEEEREFQQDLHNHMLQNIAIITVVIAAAYSIFRRYYL